MNNYIIKNFSHWIIICLVFVFISCSKNDSNFYADGENDGLAIFSNTGNNVLTCFVDDKAWRTGDRSSFIFGPPGPRYEVDIAKQITNGPMDTLLFNWRGYFTPDRNSFSYLSLALPIEKNFGFRNLSSFSGRRFKIDISTGVFSFYSPTTSLNLINGRGNIYFHKVVFDSINPNMYSGRISGLFDADFNATKITKGRFDHNINSDNVWF